MKARWDDKAAVAANLGRELPRLAGEWFEAGAEAMAPGVSWEDMHQFRLLTKRFRYTLEIFQPLYGPSLGARVELLRKLQTYLGDINDCITAEALIESEAEESPVRQALRARADRRTGELRRFWERKFGGVGQAAGWMRYLERYAGRGNRRA